MDDKLNQASQAEPRNANPFDRADGYSGQDYHRDREAALTAQDPSGGPAAGDVEPADAAPPEAGRLPGFDPVSGAVRGAGAGAGGGNPGEDHDDDEKGGGG